MCGLVGIAGDLAFKDEGTMKRMLLLDYFRGMDSTGLAVVRNTEVTKLAKIASHPLDLFDSSRFKEALNGTNSKVFIGHNRAATRGGVNGINAHPFEFDHIIGAHNGTLCYKGVNALEEALDEKFPVDSMALFAAIAKLGIEETIKLIYEGKDSTTGAWALTWYDSIEGSINFLRNKHRPLWYAFEKDFKRIFWASEWPMIHGATKLSGPYELYQEEGTGHTYWQFDENVHFKFDVDVLKKGSDKRPKAKAQTLKGKEHPPVKGPDPFQRNPTTGGGKNGFLQNVTHLTTNQTTSSNHQGGKSTTGNRVVNLLGDVGNPLAGFLDREKFEALAKYGCSWCGTDVEWDEPGILIFERDDILLCSGCAHGDADDPNVVPPNRIYTRHDYYM